MVQDRIRELTQYITPGGTVYDLTVPSRVGRWVMSQTGWGLPPIEYVSSRGPIQNGQTLRRYFLRPRTVQLLIRHDFCNRDDYWAGRGELLDTLRINQGNDGGTLRRHLTDGSLRDLTVYLVAGPAFTPNPGNTWDEFAYTEALRFTAYDPVVFDPTLKTATFSLAALTNIVFPITFPITFGSTLIDETQIVNYLGTWESLPTIILTGPLNVPTITNVTTGEVIDVQYNIPAGRVLTIDLTYGVKTVLDDLGANFIGTITPASDFGTWHLAPAPEATGGDNSIRVQATGASPGVSGIALQYFDRYLGI